MKNWVKAGTAAALVLGTGAGMVLARGCSGRLLVLAATGNLRSVVSGLIFAVVAQMADRILDKLIYSIIFPVVAVGCMWRLHYIVPDP